MQCAYLVRDLIADLVCDLIADAVESRQVLARVLGLFLTLPAVPAQGRHIVFGIWRLERRDLISALDAATLQQDVIEHQLLD